jgi:hypothetical protein
MKSKVLVLLLLVGTVGMAVSCQKEQIVKNETVYSVDAVEKIGDEDHLIKGKVKKSNQNPVQGALVETFNAITELKIGGTYTDSNGKFEQKVPCGLYFLKVTNPNSGNVFYSNAIRIDSVSLINTIEVFVD